MGPKQSLPKEGLQSQQSLKIDFEKQIGPEQELKKVIIVVGRMGHGKSSFINTLILPKDQMQGQLPDQMKKKLLKSGADLKSVTTECTLVEVNLSHNLLDQKLYAIDTPGLNSEDSICLVSQQIDNIIIQKKCEIVGIAFVINLGADRQIGGNNKSTIKQFLKLLKIDKNMKNKVLFFILSSWDVIRFGCKDQQIQRLQEQFKNYIIQIGIDVKGHQSRFIKWVNSRCNDKQSLDFFIQKKGGKAIIDQQWKDLKNILRICKKDSISPENHTKNVQQFWKITINKIFQKIQDNKISFKQQPQTISYVFERSVEFQKQINKDQKFLFVTQVTQGIALTILGVLTLEYGIGILMLSAGVTILTGSTSIFIGNVIKSKQKIQQKPQQNQNRQNFQIRIMKQKLIQQITAKLKLQAMSKVLSNIEILNDQIIIKAQKNMQRFYSLDVYYMYKNKKIRICWINSQQIQNQHRIQLQLINQCLEQDRFQELPQKKQRNSLDVRHRRPKSRKIYIKKPQNKLKIGFDLACCLPKEENYYHIIQRQCVSMFGQYK